MLCGPALYCSWPMKPQRALDDTEGAAHCLAAAAAGLESCLLGAERRRKALSLLPPRPFMMCGGHQGMSPKSCVKTGPEISACLSAETEQRTPGAPPRAPCFCCFSAFPPDLDSLSLLQPKSPGPFLSLPAQTRLTLGLISRRDH